MIWKNPRELLWVSSSYYTAKGCFYLFFANDCFIYATLWVARLTFLKKTLNKNSYFFSSQTLSPTYLKLSCHFSPSHSNMLRDQLRLQISWNQFSHWINKRIAEAVLGVLSCREEEHLHALLLLQTGTLLGWIVWLIKRTRSNPQLWHTHIEYWVSHMTTQPCSQQKKKSCLKTGFCLSPENDICCINYRLRSSKPHETPNLII